MNEEILLRSDATLADVDMKQRIVDVIAVPWEQQATVAWRGEMWDEVFSRSAFKGIENILRPILVNREHTKGDTVGKVIKFDTSHALGMLTRVKIAKTLRGDETLALAEEDMISASVGYFVKKPSDVDLNQKIKLRRVNRAFLDHLALVESPAYEGAKVLSVREGPERTAACRPLVTPNLDEFLGDDVIAWAQRRLGKQ